MEQGKSIQGVQVFAAGKWNGDKYTVDDLQEMVNAFNETSKTVRPFLKLGHSEKQKLLANDGLPAAGWIDSLYIRGEKLYADFSGIPKKIYELIEKKAYRKVSAEIYLGVKILERQYKYMLGAVALLGAETPGVMTLDDILSLYSLKDFEQIKTYKDQMKEESVKVYSFDEPNGEGDKMPTELEIKQEIELKNLKEKLEAKESETKQFKADLEAKDGESKKIADEIESLKKQVADSAEREFSAKLDAEIQGMLTEGSITIGMKPFVKAFLGTEKKEYSLKVGEEEKKFSKIELFKEMAKLFSMKDEVNMDEKTIETQRKEFAKKEDEMDDMIKKYMKDNSCSYKEAYKAVAKSKK